MTDQPLSRILIINPFGIGDVLFTTPLISNLRRAYPKSKIVYLANRRTAPMLEANGAVNEVLVYERDEFVAVYRQNPLSFAGKWFELYHTIKGESFDVVFDFSLNSTFSFLCMACGIKRRIGFDYKGRGRLLTEPVPLVGYEEAHVIEFYLDLLARAGVPVIERQMTLQVPEAATQWAKQWLKDQGISNAKPLIALIPGGGASWGAAARNKRWPVGNYAQLADKIIAKNDATIILMGDPKEVELSKELAKAAHVPLYSAVGQTSILQMAALLQQCRMAIVNDGGPLHIALAAGVRVASIFGPVDPKAYGPYPPQGHAVIQKGLACQPCYRRFRMAQCSHLSCLNDLTVDDVYRKVEGLL